jgi:tRNA (guanine37-N1)-methyltransferase
MLMTPQPVYDAWRSVQPGGRTLYLSPQGRTLTQEKALRLVASNRRLTLLCGHYEGVDERVLELMIDEEISIGDYVLTGGELPAMVLVDCLSRLVPGVLPAEEAFSSESHFDGLLEYPQYTRPYYFMGKAVPDVLLSGHHRNIERWRKEQSLERTRRKRPDLVDRENRETV